MMHQNWNLNDVAEWAKAKREAPDAIRALERIPARLSMLDADLASLPADLGHFERVVAGRGYALVGRARNVEASGRREDSRVRALLRRFFQSRDGTQLRDTAVRRRYDELMALISEHEGPPGSGKRWTEGRHRSLTILRARARCAPEALTQSEIDRLGREMRAENRKALRKSGAFINELTRLSNEIPELRTFLPPGPLAPPAGSSKARRVDWAALPAPFRSSFDQAANACVAGPGDHAKRQLARIEAGEDPETVMEEADAYAKSAARELGAPKTAREGYRAAVTWLVRAWEDLGGNTASLTDLRDVLDRRTIEAAIESQKNRASTAPDLRDPLHSATLKTRLVALTTLAKHGLGDMRIVAIVKLLRTQHYDEPRKKAQKSSADSAVLMDVDRIFGELRQRPELANVWANAPRRIADVAEREIAAAQESGCVNGEISALRRFAGAAAYAIQLSRPLRTRCLRRCRVASAGEAHSNLVRTAADENQRTFRFAPWEIKNDRWVSVDVVGDDAAIVREWIERWRPRLIALQTLAADNVYLFPGNAVPRGEREDAIPLPRGCYSISAFLDLWEDASKVLGVNETPHRIRHVVALLILASHPGDYARVATVLGNTEAVARKHYGRDDGKAAAREARKAMLASHPDLFANLCRRHDHE